MPLMGFLLDWTWIKKELEVISITKKAKGTKTEQYLRTVTQLQNCNMVIGTPGGEEKRTKHTWRNDGWEFSKIISDIKPQIQEACRITRGNPPTLKKKVISRHVIFKVQRERLKKKKKTEAKGEKRKELYLWKNKGKNYIQLLKHLASKKTVKYLKCWEKEVTNLEFYPLWSSFSKVKEK